MKNKKNIKLISNVFLWIDLYLLRNAKAYKQMVLNNGFVIAKDITLSELYKFYSKF